MASGEHVCIACGKPREVKQRRRAGRCHECVLASARVQHSARMQSESYREKRRGQHRALRQTKLTERRSYERAWYAKHYGTAEGRQQKNERWRAMYARNAAIRVRRYLANRARHHMRRVATPRHTCVLHDVEYTLESYRIGERYWDVYSSKLISKPEIDHITPVVDAGGNEWPNMAVTSRRNNAAKGALPLLQYLLALREAA